MKLIYVDYESNAWERASLHSEHTEQSNGSRPQSSYDRRPPSNYRPQSIHSSVADVPGADYWRDSSPLGPSHSSRNLREQSSRQSLRPTGHSPYVPSPDRGSRVQSMAGMSMWGGGGPGSQYGPAGPGSEMMMGMPMGGHPGMMQHSPGYFPHMMPNMGMGMGPMPHHNPFDSPGGAGSDRGSVHPQQMYPPYASPGMMPSPVPGMMGMGAPRNTVMSGLGGMAGNRGMSTYSLATTANPLMQSAPPQPSENPDPSDDEIMMVLRRYLSSQDLMSVYVQAIPLLLLKKISLLIDF